MPRLVAAVLCALAVAQSAAAAEAPPPPEARVSRTGELWKVPLYFTGGALRDAVDAPVKGISSVPFLNRILVAPLLIINTITSVVSWSGTDEGIEGGMETWMACMKLKRKRKSRRRAPGTIITRPWWSCYLPNLATGVRILANKPKPDFSSAPDAPPPGIAPALPKE